MFLLKKTLAFCLPGIFCMLSVTGNTQSAYWQQKLRYSIDVSLNDNIHALDGFMKLEYDNQSPDTLRYIWFHIWPNAYKNDRTAFSDQLLENGNTKFYFSDDEQKGYMNRLDFKVDGVTADLEDHPSHIDIVKLVLPQLLAPGKKINITTTFHVQLPDIFSRSGHDGQHYQVAQWYPKPAVYDQDGWHEMPYLDQGEFYAEFADYDVRITLPSNYAVAASGNLQDEGEKQWLAARANFSWTPKETKVKTKGGAIKRITEKSPASSPQSKTLHYTLSQAHDFAWFADKRFVVLQDQSVLSSGKTVPISVFFLPEQADAWKNVTSFAKQAIETRSRWIGEYPYAQFSVVQSSRATGGGMEYPAVTLVSPAGDEKLLHYVVAHEAGHNWFQAALGSNERSTPWLDEGLNSYYDNRYSRVVNGDKGDLQIFKAPVRIQELGELLAENAAATRTSQPMNLSSEQYTATNYNVIVYAKTAQWLEDIANDIGQDAFDLAIQNYYKQWKFRHPNWQDLKKTLEDAAGKNLDAHFAKLNETGPLPDQKRQGTRVVFPFNKKNIRETLSGKASHSIMITPAVGYNAYDKFMIGALFTNITLPVPRFQYLVAPLYGTGTRDIAGLAMFNYSIYPEHKKLYRVDVGLSAAKFGIYEFTDPTGNNLQFGMTKLAPRVRLTLRESSARSTRERYFQFKTFLFREEGLRFSRDSIFSGNDTIIVDNYGKQGVNRTLSQLKFVWEDHRALYPYRAELKLEQGKSFVRAAFTGNYFFNYANGGGLRARFFAGKFFYVGENTFAKQMQTDRYHLNMTGANGEEDYTYSDYFPGRNEFDGFASQQIMERDGAFKTRTDLLASKVGRTDDWLIALNFSSTIPNKFNPLSLLPVKIPLKVFADIGTYAEAWDRSANLDRFLFDAGLQLSLFNETINIYLPVVYSQPFKDYIQSTIPKKERLLKKISFSIDVSNFSFRKVNRNLAF